MKNKMSKTLLEHLYILFTNNKLPIQRIDEIFLFISVKFLT